MVFEQRIARTEKLLTEAAKRMGAEISEDGRVNEKIAAVLVGYEPRSFQNLRYDKVGPAHYKIPFGGTVCSYRIRDLAEWIETAREEPPYEFPGNSRAGVPQGVCGPSPFRQRTVEVDFHAGKPGQAA